jgi:hypothetical protein
MTGLPAAGAAPTRVDRFVRMPTEFARYVIDPVSAARTLGVEPDAVEALAAGLLPHAAGPDGRPRYDYVDISNLALFGRDTPQSIPDLALRFLLRFAAGDPDSWFAPRQWFVRVRTPASVAGDTVSADRLRVAPADVDAPGIEVLDDAYVARTAPAIATGTVDPPGYQIAVRVTGAADTVRDATAHRIYDEMLAALLDVDIVYQSVTEELRMRHTYAWTLGMADCVVVSRLLAERLRHAGLVARARRGYLLGLVGSDHSWCELFEDGHWKPMDVVFAFLGSGGAGSRRIVASGGFADACRGSRFNRLLPSRAAEATAVIHLDGEPAPQSWTSGVSASAWES